MQYLTHLTGEDDFPPTSDALDYPCGLLAAGGGLSVKRLLAAYRRGIFPWYEEPQPVLWWTPDPRSVLLPQNLHVSRSLARTLRRDALHLSVDQHFARVMARCAQLRGDGLGTWIGDDMVAAYCDLRTLGHAHSVEVLDASGQLVGGLYGVALGRGFFGESMFSEVTDASKVALVALVQIMRRGDFRLIDCQVESAHMNSMGAVNISRTEFEGLLDEFIDVAHDQRVWTLPATCGDLL